MAIHHYIFLLLTGLVIIYLLWRFYTRWSKTRKIYDYYYIMGFLVLLVSGLLLLILTLDILKEQFVLTVASLIPLGISIGIIEEYFAQYKRIYKWVMLVGFLAIALSFLDGSGVTRKISVPLFHGIAGLVIFLGPFLAKQAPKGFWWVGIGGLLIGIGGIALAFISVGKPLPLFTEDFVMTILTPLLFLMSLAFTWGFVKDIKG